MMGYMASFVLGVFVAQEYKIPNVKITAQDIIKRFKK